MAKIFETALYPYCKSPDQDRSPPAHHKVLVIGAGPVGLAAAIDLALKNIPVVVLDENDNVSRGSRAICFAKRPLEILDRLGCGDPVVNKGVQWNIGKVFFDRRQVFTFDLQPEGGHKRPAFINLQQYWLEHYLVDRVNALKDAGYPISLRGGNRVTGISNEDDRVVVDIDTPDGSYQLTADYVIACDGAASPTRTMLGLDFVGRVFEDNFLIADIVMDDSPDFAAERRFWFDPPFNRGQSALLHKQPDKVWRIDLQLGWDIDKQVESRPENVIPRLKAFLGESAKFELEWVSIYTFQCRRMEKFRHGRILFAGDSAHQVSPFGARGANSGFQDTDNLVWKLQLVLEGKAPQTLLDTYESERIRGADENILNSTRSTDFITPKSEISRLFRDAVLDLSEHFPATRPMVNSGRLSVPCTYDASSLNGPDHPDLPECTRPGSPAMDAPAGKGWLVDQLGNCFHLLAIDLELPGPQEQAGLFQDNVRVEPIALWSAQDPTGFLRKRYLGTAERAVYLMRPDQHVAARWTQFDAAAIRQALLTCMGRS